jgi:hypothetical protein
VTERTIALVACLWLVASNAGAVCPCVPRTVEQTYQGATLVFTGEVSGFTPVNSRCETVPAEDAVGAVYTVRVIEELKGPSARKHRLFAADPASRSRADRAHGPARLERWSRDVGKRFLWFASGEGNLIDSCASSELRPDMGIDTKLDELRQLRAARRSGGDPAPTPPSDAAQPCSPPPCG